jgi:hypothetical protein
MAISLIAQLTPLLTIDLAKSFAVFAVQTFACWGLGDVIVGALWQSPPGTSRLSRPLLALAIGSGVFGEVLFAAGAMANAYQPWIVGAIFVGLSLLAATRLRLRGLSEFVRVPRDVGVAGWMVVAMTAWYGLTWLWLGLGFHGGSDVFNHHYPFVKLMVREQHFAHPAHLPFGLDWFSSYNPALGRMLWLPGQLFADERASNLVHWLQQLQLVGCIYVLGRDVATRRAGLLGVAAYLTIGLMAYNPIEAQDYTLVAIYVSLAAYVIVAGTRSLRELALAGVLGGLMMSSKYYGMPMFAVMTGALLYWVAGPWPVRLRHVAYFAAVAALVFLPWVLYNLAVFHDPFFPLLLDNEEIRHNRATGWVSVLASFVLPTDRSFLEPTAVYYLSLFIPFSLPFRTMGLSVIFLIGLPCSVYCLLFGRDSLWRQVNWLAVVAVVSLLALHVAVGHDAFYKWALFPAVLYAAAFGVMVERLRAVPRMAFWGATLVALALNYWYLSHAFYGDATFNPPVADRRSRWSEVTKYLNENMEPGAVISGTDSGFDLRTDLTAVPDSPRVSTDWLSEREVMRRLGVTYIIVDANELPRDQRFSDTWSGIWRQLSPADELHATYIDDSNRRHQQRTREREAFLQRYGTLVHDFSIGPMYRIRWAEVP